MSMSVYAMDYNNSLVQNQQNSAKPAEERSDREEMKQAELEQSVGSAKIKQDKYREDGVLSMAQRMKGTEAYRQVKEGRESSGETEDSADGQLYSGAVRMDTAVISEEGRRAYLEMNHKGGEMNESRDTMSAKEAEVKEKQDTVSEEEEYKIEDLSEYTDTELKQMYYRGEITLQEYEDETGEALE